MSELNFIDKFITQVREDEEKFIFETIHPYCTQITRKEISKQDLKEALELWMYVKSRFGRNEK